MFFEPLAQVHRLTRSCSILPVSPRRSRRRPPHWPPTSCRPAWATLSLEFNGFMCSSALLGVRLSHSVEVHLKRSGGAALALFPQGNLLPRAGSSRCRHFF